VGEGQGAQVVVRAAEARRMAVRGTAELVRRYKSLLHRAGAFDLELPRGARLPAWSEVFFEVLRQRPGKWRVVALRGRRGATLHRVIWLHWTHYGRREARLPGGARTGAN
jgi:hypothetical protein